MPPIRRRFVTPSCVSWPRIAIRSILWLRHQHRSCEPSVCVPPPRIFRVCSARSSTPSARPRTPTSSRPWPSRSRPSGPSWHPSRPRPALGPVLDAIRQTTDPYSLQALAKAVQTLGPKLAPEQAQAALGPVLDAIRQTTNYDLIQALAKAVQSLGPTPEQAQAALGPVLDAIRQTTDRYQLQALAQAVQSVGPKLAQSSTEILRTMLAAAVEPSVAEAYARAIVVTRPLDPAKPQA